VTGGLERALYEKQRPGDPPDGQACWTVRLIAAEAVKRKLVLRGGRETIPTFLEGHDLKLWRQKMWRVAELNHEYIEKMEDVLAVYEKSYNAAVPVLCIDERPATLHVEVRPPISMALVFRRNCCCAFFVICPEASKRSF
jgi:hypothetical protein